jgi:uncharacterized repeat protein (TIGR01451 family)
VNLGNRFSPLLATRLIIIGMLGLQVPQAIAQFKITESFTQATAPGWTLADNASLTAPSIDAAGAGWLRLTSATNDQRGTARYTAGTFTATQALTVRFRYVSWGGSGADGITLFLYDATQNMAGALEGGGLGYCFGAGGYLAIGLDEFGNFSNPGDRCTAGGGPGFVPDAFVIRGPVGSGNPFVTNALVASGIDDPAAVTRPTARTVMLSLVPVGVGFTISAQFQNDDNSPMQSLFSGVSFPYAPPTSLSVGFSGSTGGATNIHEVQSLTIATSDDVQITVSGPASVVQGNQITYNVTVTNNGPAALSGTDAPTVTDNLPAGITGITWTCSGSAGASCTASGTGNLNTSTLTLPVNGSVTYQILGTVPSNAACGATTIVNTATVDFGGAARYLDPNQANNTAAATTAVDCLDATPNTFSFTPLTGVPAASVQTSNAITVTGTNGPAPISITGGEYSINGGPFTSLAGTVPPGAQVVVRVTAATTPNTTTTATLTIGGVSAPFSVTTAAADTVPDAFSFAPLTGVAPASTQTSNTITLAGTNAPAPISITGGEYSINGGPFTAAAGTVPPGAQVTVRLTAASAFSTLATALLTIGGVSAPFNVTTRAAQPGILQFSSPTFTGSGANPTVTITVTRTGGTDGAVSANVLDAQGNVVGTVNFANGVGGSQNVVIPLNNAAGGATLNLRLVSPTGGATIGAVNTATVTITAAPLAGVVIKSRSGGGAMSGWPLLLLGLVVLWQLARSQGRRVGALAGVILAFGLGSTELRAHEVNEERPGLYLGLRGGYSTSELSNNKVTRELRELGYDVSASDLEKDAPTGTFYLGYGWNKHWAMEAGWTYLGRTYANLSGTTPPNLNQLLNDAIDVTHGAGEAVSLALRYRFEFSPRVGMDIRAGGYRWKNRTTICIGDVDRLTRVDKGNGETVGIGPHFKLRDNLHLGVNVDYFRSTRLNSFLHGSISLEYRPPWPR